MILREAAWLQCRKSSYTSALHLTIHSLFLERTLTRSLLTQEPDINYHHPRRGNWKYSCLYKKKTGFICAYYVLKEIQLTLEERRHSKSNRNPCPTPTGLCPTTTDYCFPIMCVFKKTAYGWKEFARASRRRLHQMCEPCSLTVATHCLLTDFWLCSHWSKGTPRTWKPPQRRQKTHSLWGCLPSFHRHYSVLSPGEKGCSVPLSCRDPCFPPGFTVGPAACCHSLFEGTHRHFGCSPGSPQDMKEEREVYSDSPPPRSKKGWIRPETTLQFQSYPFKLRPFFHVTHYLLVQASAGAAGVCSLYCIAQTVMVSALCFLSQKWQIF